MLEIQGLGILSRAIYLDETLRQKSPQKSEVRNENLVFMLIRQKIENEAQQTNLEYIYILPDLKNRLRLLSIFF